MSFARAVLGGAGLLAAAGVVTKLFGLLSSPILTRLVGPSPYGIVALVGTISSLATTVAIMGVELPYARFYFDGGGEEGEAVERFCWRFALGVGLVLSLLAWAGWRWGSGPLSAPEDLGPVVAGTTIVAVAISMATTRQRVRGAYSRIAAGTVAGGGVAVALSILFALRWRPDAWAMLVGVLAGALVAHGHPRDPAAGNAVPEFQSRSGAEAGVDAHGGCQRRDGAHVLADELG